MAGEGPIGYSGQGFSLRGEKGRYVLPPAFRKAIAPTEDTPKLLCLATHARWPCLVGFADGHRHAFEAQVERDRVAAEQKGLDFDWEERMSQLWSCLTVPFDGSGRFVLPEALADVAGIGDAIAFLGGSPFFTLWAPEALYAMGDARRGQIAVCKAQAAEALKARGK